MSNQAPPPKTLPVAGIVFAVSCYFVWGVVPVYWKAIPEMPATHALIPRVLWTLIVLGIAALVTGRLHETMPGKIGRWRWPLVSALLISFNWCVFVYAVFSNQVVATSLGYYINPLMSILLGLVVLRERLNRLQAVAIAIAAFGVGTLTIRIGELPWISLALAVSFALYGLTHKMQPQPALAGLTREMMILTPPSLLALGLLAMEPDSAFAKATLGEHAFLALSGVVTAVPLLLFHAATRRLPLVAVGMFQYIAPTLTLALATLVYEEPFTEAHAMGFGSVWMGLAIFSADSIMRARLSPTQEAARSLEPNAPTDETPA